ncbi:hypothetical protein FACS189481_6060 [Clostridia bacterium]|nr:hypothetical protein FACS189481_6060 [Clostridia bacterium]
MKKHKKVREGGFVRNSGVLGKHVRNLKYSSNAFFDKNKIACYNVKVEIFYRRCPHYDYGKDCYC